VPSHPSQRILLTGGAGFIGSHLAESLLRLGARVAIIDNLDEFYAKEAKVHNLDQIKNCGNFEFHEIDIRNFDALRTVVQEFRPEAIIHLAARAGVRPSIEQPRLYEEVNVRSTYNLLELAREFKVPRFVFGSSSSVYGQTSRIPFTEDDPALHPISPYAATKMAGELACYTYAHLYGIKTLCLRFFTVYGPRQRPDLAIHKFTRLIETGQPISIFGDGSMSRDYTFVDDIVAGILAALRYEPPQGRVPFEVFNLGNSQPVKLIDLVRHLEVATGRKAVCDFQPLQPGDVPITFADIRKAQSVLGYEPRVRFTEGVSQFVSWYRGRHS
jgi:UDP-glucuronate 4-epimerase